MLGLIGFVLLCVGCYFVWGISSGIAGFLFLTLLSAVIGFVGEALVPGERMDGGWFLSVGAAVVGTGLGGAALGSFGGLVVAGLMVGVVTYVSRAWVGEKTEPRVFESAGVVTYSLSSKRG
jgi:hypothetical protein